MAEFSDWSIVAANNNSTPPDGWPEGMAPSTVNNAAREMMAVLKRKFRDTHETRVISVAASITRADLGKLTTLTGGTYALTYEAAADLGSDFTHTIICEATEVTLTPDGVEKIRVNGADENNLAVVTGQFVRVWSDGSKLFASVLPSTRLFDNSLGGESGYQKLPEGMIIQWMTVTAGTGTSGNVAWPIAFPNNVRQIVCIHRGANDEAARGAHVRALSASTVSIYRWTWSKSSTDNAVNSSTPVAVIAIGD